MLVAVAVAVMVVMLMAVVVALLMVLALVLVVSMPIFHQICYDSGTLVLNMNIETKRWND